MDGADPAEAAAKAALEAEAKKQRQEQGSSILGDVARAAADAVDLVCAVVESVTSAIGGSCDL